MLTDEEKAAARHYRPPAPRAPGFIQGRDAIFAEYCRRVEPMYQRMLAEKDMVKTRYEAYRLSIRPHLQEAIAKIAVLRSKCSQPPAPGGETCG